MRSKNLKDEVERLRAMLVAAEEELKEAAAKEGEWHLLPPFVEDYRPYTKGFGVAWEAPLQVPPTPSPEVEGGEAVEQVDEAKAEREVREEVVRKERELREQLVAEEQREVPRFQKRVQELRAQQLREEKCREQQQAQMVAEQKHRGQVEAEKLREARKLVEEVRQEERRLSGVAEQKHRESMAEEEEREAQKLLQRAVELRELMQLREQKRREQLVKEQQQQELQQEHLNEAHLRAVVRESEPSQRCFRSVATEETDSHPLGTPPPLVDDDMSVRTRSSGSGSARTAARRMRRKRQQAAARDSSAHSTASVASSIATSEDSLCSVAPPPPYTPPKRQETKGVSPAGRGGRPDPAIRPVAQPKEREAGRVMDVVGLTTDETLQHMENPSCIRNLSVIAHVDAGKSTLTDALLTRSGVTSRGDRWMDSMPEERERGITIKAAAVTLGFRLPEDRGVCVANLIDCPGHVDFSCEVTAALRVSDGALVVLDCVEGVQAQTETVLQQARAERVVPAIALNKVDRLMTQLKLDHETCYQRLYLALEAVAAHAWTPDDGGVMGVCFTSGLHGWGFTLRTIARLHERKLGAPPGRLERFLWGEWYWNEAKKEFSKKRTDSSVRGFCHFVLRPLYAILEAATEGDHAKVEEALEILWSNQGLTKEERGLTGVPLFAAVLRRLLPAADALVEVIHSSLPSPPVAQRYRAEVLALDGEKDTIQAIQACDPDGPLIMYVSKLVPVKKTWNFYYFGRVFSGSVSAKAGVTVLAAGGKASRTVQSANLLMGRHERRVDRVGAGCLVALGGLDQAGLVKSGTLISSSGPLIAPLRELSHKVAPVVRAAVECPSAQVTGLAKALRWLACSDPLVVCSAENGQSVIGAAGELHLELCLKALNDRMQGPPGTERDGVPTLKSSDPTVPYREGVEAPSPAVMCKSPTKLNRITVQVSPLSPELASRLEEGEVTGEELVEKWGWDRGDARGVWAVGPEGGGTNILVNRTFGLSYIGEIRQHVVQAFHEATAHGVLCGEPMRGVRVDIVDATIHTDPHHRGPGEIIPPTRRAIFGAVLQASPVLFEPIFRCSVGTAEETAGTARGVIIKRRGAMEDEVYSARGVRLIASVPVATSFGMTGELRQATSGKAYPEFHFDRWERIPGTLHRETKRSPSRKQTTAPATPPPPSLLAEAVTAARKRSKLPDTLPPFTDFCDKL
eukprot:Sspe_Gene.2774::Locus_921_Transcript_3_3_Confidence_0.556_Length_3696::g.2774::m.2774/K03234/EEF2; elongation factor 2